MSSSSTESDRVDDCAVCFQPITLSMRLPECNHEFCFLCIKGVAIRQGHCPLCRRPISMDLFHNPRLTAPAPVASVLNKETSEEEATSSSAIGDSEFATSRKAGDLRRRGPPVIMDQLTHTETNDANQTIATVTPAMEWYYEARGGGWWRYDARHEADLEQGFAIGGQMVLLIAGYSYVVDFERMCQYRQDNGAVQHRMVAGRNRPIAVNRAIRTVLRCPSGALSLTDVRGIAGLGT